MKQAREAEPYLAKFEDDWATGQILRQYINGKQKYENAKANGKVNIGGKGRRTSATRPSPSNDEIDQATQADPSVAYILLELVASLHPGTLSNGRSASCASFAKSRKAATS